MRFSLSPAETQASSDSAHIGDSHNGGKHPLVQADENSQLKTDLPEFAPGDTVVVQ